MLQDESLEYIKEQYEEKNMVLKEFGEEVSSWQMYEDIFNDLDQILPIVFIDEEEQKHIVPMSIYEAIEQSKDRNDVLMGGSSYFNNWISKATAQDVYTFIIDMDNVYSGTLLNALRQDWATANKEKLPKPTYIVNSGTGLHLYFVLSDPIPNYKCSTENIDRLYRALAIQQTTKRVYLKKQVQWFGQDFRMGGGLNKYEWRNTCFKIGDKWDIDDLGKEVGLKDTHFIRYGEKRTASTKISNKRSRKEKREGWRSNRAFYDYSLRNCHEKTKEGNRYTSMCALTTIAWKCNVSKEELQADLLGLLPDYNKGATRQIKEREIYSALKMYNSKAMLTQRTSLENWQGWEYKPIKRNGRKRADHIIVMNKMKEVKKLLGEEINEGRPSKEELVKEYVKLHPDENVSMISRSLGISRTTVYKYCNSL